MSQSVDFIPQNIAPKNIRRIGIYNTQGNRVGQIPLGHLTFPSDAGAKQYSFGALSDVHIVYQTAASDFKKALTFLNNEIKVAFTCIAGDLTDNGTAEQLEQYAEIVSSHSYYTPVYAIAGNHEEYSKQPDLIKIYTGHPLYYSFTHNDDVFLMCGCYSWENDGVFTEEYLQWIYETLESNRNKRCFIFEHVFPWGDCGNPGGFYSFDMFSGKKGGVFLSLLNHYKNTIFFHGHSHTKFELQDIDKKANYSEAAGYRSVHIPSLAVPRDIVDSSLSNIYADSEGYVVDVYKNGIHLKGRDFVKDEYLPIASYWLDTTLTIVPEKTYVDSTGIIKT